MARNKHQEAQAEQTEDQAQDQNLAQENASTDSQTPGGTQDLTIQGVVFTAPAPYSAGYVLKANEAEALNGLLGENLRNNFAARMRKIAEDNEKAGLKELTQEQLDQLQADFAEYAAGYEFSGKRGTAQVRDPIEREALRIARPMVMEKLKEAKIDVKTLKEGVLDKLISDLSQRPAIREEAVRRLEAVKAAASISLEGLFPAEGEAEVQVEG